MNDNDLIRREDALAALNDLWVTADNDREEGYDEGLGAGIEAINAIPAVSPDVVALVEAAEKVINSYWHSTDGVITGIYDLEAALARVKGVM